MNCPVPWGMSGKRTCASTPAPIRGAMKANHQSQQFRLEDNLLKYFPEEIERNKGFIKGLETDMTTLDAHPHPKDGFAGIVVRGDSLTDKDNAGAAILEACKEVKGLEPMEIGSYRGFTMRVTPFCIRRRKKRLMSWA